MKIKPLADRVLVKNDKAETKTSSGIIIPEAAQEKTQTATVVEVGPGTDDVKITIKKGDRIMYDKYAGTQIKIDGEDHLILRMSDIIAVIEQLQFSVKYKDCPVSGSKACFGQSYFFNLDFKREALAFSGYRLEENSAALSALLLSPCAT